MRFPDQPDARLRKLAPAIVLVNFDMPYTVSGVSEQHYFGTGLVVDATLGYIAVDRNTVPEALGDVRVTFGGSLEIPARVVYVHPLHNLVLLAYDPGLVRGMKVTTALLVPKSPGLGEDLWVVGLRQGEKLVAQSSAFNGFEPLTYPLSRTLRFRESNLEALNLVSGPQDLDGVVVNRKAEVVALWSSFAWQGAGELSQENRGLPIKYVQEMIDLVKRGRKYALWRWSGPRFPWLQPGGWDCHPTGSSALVTTIRNASDC